MELSKSQVHRNLDVKFKIGGLEATDLLIVLLTAAILNLIFGASDFAVLATLLPPALVFCVLYFGKKGKPEDYLAHSLRYLWQPGFYAAGLSAKDTRKRMRKAHVSSS